MLTESEAQEYLCGSAGETQEIKRSIILFLSCVAVIVMIVVVVVVVVVVAAVVVVVVAVVVVVVVAVAVVVVVVVDEALGRNKVGQSLFDPRR